jgi:hypothetical protein
MQVTAGVVSGSENVAHFSFENVCDGAIEPDLMAPQVEPAIPAIRGEILLGSAVVEGLAVELGQGAPTHAPKGAAHARAGIILGDFPMTSGAPGRIHIAGVGSPDQKPSRLGVADRDSRENPQQSQDETKSSDRCPHCP